jgi:HlyD family secretion protein
MTQAKKKSSKWWIWLLVGIILLLIVVVAINARKKPKGEQVETEVVALREIREVVSASGKIFPEKEVKISSDVSGEVVELYVEEGDSVKAGQILAKIDPEEYASAVERGTASVNASKSELARSRSGIENAQAQIEQISAQIDNQRKIHERNKKLRADGVISAQDLEASESQLMQLEANLRSAEASRRAAEQGVKSAEYNVASTQASLKEIRTSLSRTTITAPTAGIISKLNVEQGELVVGTMQMTGTEMMRIANFSSMEVQVEVSENDILRVTIGDTADIEVDAYLDKKFQGVVTEVASSAANTSNALGQEQLTSDQVTNFIVKIRILPESYSQLANQKMPFRPGMSATVDINTHTERGVIAIPIQAVTTREKDKPDGDAAEISVTVDKDEEVEEVVFVMQGDTSMMVHVTTGVQDNEYIQILTGIQPGQEVITGPYSIVSRKLKNGTRVERKEKEDQEDKGKKGDDAVEID